MQIRTAVITAAVFSLCLGMNVQAQVIFKNGFEPFIDPLFPTLNGDFQLPSGATVDQLEWVLAELAQPSTELNEISAHFNSSWAPTAAQDWLDTLRTYYPSARVVDVLTVTPIFVRVVIQSGDGTSGLGFLTMDVDWAQGQKIGYFSVGAIAPGPEALQYLEDQNLTLAEAADKFQTISAANSILIARINAQGQCVPVVGRQASTLRGTGSIFKEWVLGGVADLLESGNATPEQLVSIVASEVSANTRLSNVPLGTTFTLADMTTMMMAISDNTATDHMHELAGRNRLNQFVRDSGVADPDVLIPLLSVNEQFHLFSTVPLVDALAYVNGTEPFQADYVENTLVPLGPTQSYAVFNKQLLSTGSWRASPMDICQTMATLREYPAGSAAMDVINQAFGSESAQPFVRNRWDRVWYKGGSLAEATNAYHVYTHSWMLENNGEDAWVVVAMANDPGGVINLNSEYEIQSLTSRILQVLSEQ